MKPFSFIITLFIFVGCFYVSLINARQRRRRLQAEDEDPSLVFSVTYRDFMPATCFFALNPGSNLTQAELDAAYAQIELDAWLTDTLPERDTTCAVFKFVFQGTPGKLAAQALLREGIISGHPDFEALRQRRNQAKCPNDGIVPGVDFPVGSCIFQVDNGVVVKNEFLSIIKDELEVGSNGLAKPVYCSDVDGENTRCGFVQVGQELEQTQTQKKFFDVWYNDDDVYNRRIGQNLVLKPVDGNNALFAFDADESVDDPDFGTDQVLGHFGPLGRFKLFDDALDIEELLFDIVDAPAWPRTITPGSVDNTDGKTYYITTELHTTFEYRANESMFFEFSGDDDFWCFINNKLVIDLGGVHSRFDASIDLNSDFNGLFNVAEHLGLVDGEVATLDIFHAERQTSQSAFKITTSLFPACNVQQSGSRVIDLNFSEDIEFLELSSGASFDPILKEITLQENNTPFSSSFVFTKVQENVGRGFVADFEISLSGITDGFAFIIQAEGIEDFPVLSGPTFGLTGLSRSFGVVFDFCPNRDLITSTQDCSGQTVSVHHSDNSTSPNGFNLQTRKTFDSVSRNLKRSEFFPIQIVHYGGKPNFLEVYVNSSLYLRELDFNISEILQGSGGHVGVVATSSDVSTDIKMRNFALSTVEVEPTRTVFVNETVVVQEVLADGESTTDGVSVITADFCENQLEAGTLGFLFDAKFIQVVDVISLLEEEEEEEEQSLSIRRLQEEEEDELFVEDATIQDNGDGSYNVQLKTLVPGLYKLAVAFGEGCLIEIIESNQTVNINGTVLDIEVLIPVLSSNSPEDCFFSEFADGEVIAVAEPLDTSFNTSDVDDPLLDTVPLLIIAIISSVCFLAALIGIIAFVRKRKKWNDEKEYVPTGELFKTELDTKFDKQNEFNTTGMKVLQTQQEILDLQTHAALNQRHKEIKTLKNENDELKEALRQSRMEAEVEEDQNEAMVDESQIGEDVESQYRKNQKTEL